MICLFLRLRCWQGLHQSVLRCSSLEESLACAVASEGCNQAVCEACLEAQEAAQEAQVQLQRQLYLSMRKTANYREAQGSGKGEDGAASANFVVAAAQSRASGRGLIPACSRQCSPGQKRGTQSLVKQESALPRRPAEAKAPRKRLQRRRRLLLRRHAEFVGDKSLCHNSIFSLSLSASYICRYNIYI